MTPHPFNILRSTGIYVKSYAEMVLTQEVQDQPKWKKSRKFKKWNVMVNQLPGLFFCLCIRCIIVSNIILETKNCLQVLKQCKNVQYLYMYTSVHDKLIKFSILADLRNRTSNHDVEHNTYLYKIHIIIFRSIGFSFIIICLTIGQLQSLKASRDHGEDRQLFFF